MVGPIIFFQKREHLLPPRPYPHTQPESILSTSAHIASMHADRNLVAGNEQSPYQHGDRDMVAGDEQHGCMGNEQPHPFTENKQAATAAG